MKALLAHLVGDYLVQNDWMASTKTQRHLPAVVHGATYAAAFTPLTRDPRALLVIGGTHAVIDRYRLARYVVWARNQVAPALHRYPLAEAGPFGQRGSLDQVALAQRMGWIAMTERPGFNAGWVDVPKSEVTRIEEQARKSTPLTYERDWLHGWLLFLADNTIHALINEWALARWPRC